METNSSDPPFYDAYKVLLDKSNPSLNNSDSFVSCGGFVVEERELPVIDLRRLEAEDEEVVEDCKKEIARASKEWGFFQVVNHGISSEILKKMRVEQEKAFKQPFEEKVKEDKFFNFSSGTYRWGAPNATTIRQLSWSEAFHIPLTDILGSSTRSNSLR